MKNKIDYSKLSDFEINKAVAEKQVAAMLTNSRLSANEENVRQWTPAIVADYCNSWPDMGPIIQREKITIDAPFGKDKNWQASYWSDKTKRFELEADHLNPLRAAAIVYLMVGDEDEK